MWEKKKGPDEKTRDGIHSKQYQLHPHKTFTHINDQLTDVHTI